MFEVGHIIRRRVLHDIYGGQRQGGISTPARYPFILLFTGHSGEAFGYRDGWQDGVFLYTGEGQIGDMLFVRGNRAVRDHSYDGKDLHLFEIQRGDDRDVRYIGQVTCAGYRRVSGVPDKNGNPRTAIVFLLATTATVEPIAIAEGRADPAGKRVASQSNWHMPMDRLRQVALQGPVHDVPPSQALHMLYQRSEAVRTYVLRRAGGVCEGCGHTAPFKNIEGRPYLETHHNAGFPTAARIVCNP